MAGEEFGTVMRMVAEEVYLKTGGRQRPWVNESLSRLLYFGEPAPDPTGDEGDMLAERRQLLLTVAALPNPERRRVEQAAEGVGVPMDRLYGLLRALGADAPANPDELDALLRTEAARMASLVAEREMVVSPDPEIIRLSAMADRAEGEGLLETARRLRDRAKTRFRNIEPTLEEQQDALDARFIEGAEVFSRSAETRALAFDYGGAAADYGEAYARVEGRDIGLAWKYKLREANSLYDRGRTHTDNDALRRAVASAKQANALAETALRNITTMPPEMAAGDVDDMARVTESFRIVSGFLAQQQRDQIARAQHDLGNMLQDLGERLGDDTFMHEAEAAYATALQVWNRQDNPVEWLRTSSAIATLRTTLGQRQAGMAGLDAAVSTFERLLAELPEGLPDGDVGALLVNHGRALLLSGTRADDRGRLLAAADTYEAAVARLPRATAPLDWAAAQNNRGSVLLALAERSDDDPDLLAQARTAFELSLEERTRDRVPYDWAQARHNLGVALYRAGWKARDPVRLRESLAVLGDTLQEWTREQTPRDWALATSSLADVLARLGELENDPARQREAVAAWRDTLSVWTAQAAPSEWARTQANLGRTLIALAQGNEERQDLVEAIDAYEALVTEWTYEKAAYSWAQAQRTMGGAWQTLWTRGAPIESLENSIAAYRASTRVFTLDTDVQRWSDAEDKIGAMQVVLGLNRKSPEQVAEGRARFVAVRDALRAAGHDQFEAHFHERLTLADQALAALQPEPPGPPANR
jgi:tetratricopeptide (TPR) repeat protein